MVRRSFLCALAFSLPTPAATAYFAFADSGSDANPGTFAAPFKSLQRCLDAIAAPGDVCTLRKGVYEAVNKDYTAAGLPGMPIEVRGYMREIASIQQGVVPVWRKEASTNVWSTDFDYDGLVAAQRANTSYYERGIRLWRGNEILQEATWPTMVGTIFHHSTWTAQANTNDNYIFSPNIPGVVLTGAKVLTFNGSQGGVDARTVLSSGAGWVQITPGTDPWSVVAPGSRFWIQGVRTMIDGGNQWGWDPVQKRIYLRTFGYDPNAEKVRIQTSSIAWALKGTQNWLVYNINFQGTSVFSRSASSNIEFSNIYVHEPGLVRWPDAPYDLNQFSGMILGPDSKIHHSLIEGCDARCLNLYGANDTVANNVLSFTTRLGQFEGAVSVLRPGAVIRANLIDHSGSDGIAFLATNIGGSIVRRNQVQDFGLGASEAAGVRMLGNSTASTRVRVDSNLFYKSSNNGSGVSIEATRSADVFRNVFSTLDIGMVLTGDGSGSGLWGNRIVSNSTYGLRRSLLLREPGSLAGSTFSNNILSGTFATCPRISWPLVETPVTAGTVVGTGIQFLGNLDPAINPLYKMPSYNDFSLLSGSPAIQTGAVIPALNTGIGADPALLFPGAAPDIGALTTGLKPWAFGNFDQSLTNPILGMEDPNLWHGFWTGSPIVKTYSTDRVEGAFSLSLTPSSDWIPIESEPVDWDLVKGMNQYEMSIKLPKNWNWVSSLQLFFDAPSLGLYNEAISNYPLSAADRGVWLPLVTYLPQSVVTKLAKTDRVIDFRIRLCYNAEPGTAPVLLDNIHFTRFR